MRHEFCSYLGHKYSGRISGAQLTGRAHPLHAKGPSSTPPVKFSFNNTELGGPIVCLGMKHFCGYYTVDAKTISEYSSLKNEAFTVETGSLIGGRINPQNYFRTLFESISHGLLLEARSGPSPHLP